MTALGPFSVEHAPRWHLPASSSRAHRLLTVSGRRLGRIQGGVSLLLRKRLWALEEVLDEVDHRQLVWTIPKVLRPAFCKDRKLLGELCRCAWASLRDYVASRLGPGSAPGAILTIQTWGDRWPGPSFGSWHRKKLFYANTRVELPCGSISSAYSDFPAPPSRVLPRLLFWFRFDEEDVFVCIHLMPRTAPGTLVPCHDFIVLCTIVEDAIFDH